MADTGEDVKQALTGRLSKAYSLARKYLGDPETSSAKPNTMKDVPDTNVNKKAWQEATKYTAKPAPIVDKTLGTAKRATKGKASQKTTRKRQ